MSSVKTNTSLCQQWVSNYTSLYPILLQSTLNPFSSFFKTKTLGKKLIKKGLSEQLQLQRDRERSLVCFVNEGHKTHQRQNSDLWCFYFATNERFKIWVQEFILDQACQPSYPEFTFFLFWLQFKYRFEPLHLCELSHCHFRGSAKSC